MIVLFQCVAEAFVENGLRGLAELVPAGGAIFDIAKATWEKYSRRCKEDEQRRDIERLAQLNFDEAKSAAIEAVRQAMTGAEHEQLGEFTERYLIQIPESIRCVLRRPEDRTGRTIPPWFELSGVQDVTLLLPRFCKDLPLPGAPHWILDRQLGMGGFGEVWLAKRKDDPSFVQAVKFFRNLRSPEVLRREASKVREISKLSPHVVQMHEFRADVDSPWIAFEFVDGGDLEDFMNALTALPIDTRQRRTISALRQLAQAAGKFHQQDPPVVHRDLKPANILFDRKAGKLKIIDFGIAEVAVRQASTVAFNGAYSALYASPQQRCGLPPDPRDDVHALGIIGYQMLTGQTKWGVCSDFAKDLEAQGVEAALIELIGSCAAQNPDRRPKDGASLEALLGRLPKPVAPDIRKDEDAYFKALNANAGASFSLRMQAAACTDGKNARTKVYLQAVFCTLIAKLLAPLRTWI